MKTIDDYIKRLETKIKEQINSQLVGFLLGAGSSYLNACGYPLAFELWPLIKNRITDPKMRADIQAKLDGGANGLEHALDLLDDGGAKDTPYRHLVTAAISEDFLPRRPILDYHSKFVTRLSKRNGPAIKIFSLNYDPLIERASEFARIRLADGYIGTEAAYFDPCIFEERVGRIRGTHKGKIFEETVRPIHLLKLHGSIGWFEDDRNIVRKCSYNLSVPVGKKLLMIPPQRRKAADTMLPPFSALWSAFRGCLGQDPKPLNRLVCIGYGFTDEHVNAIIEPALGRTDFTLMIFTKLLTDSVWNRWSSNKKTIIVTESRCALLGEIGPGHGDLWSFEKLVKEI
jgi:hypothetical protein